MNQTSIEAAPPSTVLIGLMSGTSLDGISAAAVRFTEEQRGRPRADILAFIVRDYSPEQRARLASAINGATPAEYTKLFFDLGSWLADAAVAVIAEAGIPRDEIAAVASHGQTLWHLPAEATWQVGESAVIAERTGLDVISDFRVRDVAAGGHGAPLVSIADALLFSSKTEWRALQNLGGIGNVTIVPPNGTIEGVYAFDTGPGVVVIDGVVQRLVPGARYDADGALARAGRVIDAVVDRALLHPYFAAEPPKSTGRELFTPAYVDAFLADCFAERPDATAADCVATAVAFTARAIGDAFRRFIPEPVAELLASGGGAENPAIVDALGTALPEVRVTRFADHFFHGEAKEAVAFALLGYLFLQRRAGNVPRVTGARGPRILGKLTPK